MVKWFMHRRLAAFEKEFGYDASFMHHVLDEDFGAFLRFARATAVGQYRKDIPLDLYTAVGLTGTLLGDCGPCTQLGVTMALRQGVPGATIAGIVSAEEGAMSDDARLGRRFARAVVARSADADALREEIARLYGARGVIAVGLALVASQMYPTFKYAIGYGHACQRLDVDGRTIVPKLAPA